MTGYAVAELKESEEGGFCPRGAAKELWKSRDFETVIAGAAETGKTFSCCEYLDALLWKYPGAQGVMLRKTYSALVTSALRTYKRIIGNNSPVKAYGGEKPEWFDYPNGSRLWIAGLDNAAKALSTERDFFYINQAEEILLEEWETLMTRCTGRGAVMPYTRIFGDANPGPPTHWIINRPSMKVLHSRHEDNPTLYTEAGQVTEQGRRTLEILDKLTGTRYQRLRLGKWVRAEGAVYEEFDRGIHLIPSFPIPPEWRRIRAIDFGYTNPFVCQWFAIDPDGRMYLYREIYMTQRLVKDHAKQIRELSEGERIEVTVADHDAEDRATLHSEGILTRPAFKAISPGLQATAQRLKTAGDGKARLFVFSNALVEVDESLEDDKSKPPYSTEKEFEVYVWPKGVDGKPLKEVPLDANNHGMDSLRYACCYVDNIGKRRGGAV